MKKYSKFAIRLLKIAISLAIMVVLVISVGSYLRKKASEAHIETSKARIAPMTLLKSSEYQVRPVSSTTPIAPNVPGQLKVRSVKDYYARRAYPGAPPSIPHPINNETLIKQDCNSCHEKGGYVPQYSAFTPVTPHPDFENCLQCHGLNIEKGLFREIDWYKIKPPSIGHSALPGGPPQIPHELQLRKNCQACHSGAAALVEFNCPHPERINCIQCHTPKRDIPDFSRPLDGGLKQK